MPGAGSPVIELLALTDEGEASGLPPAVTVPEGLTLTDGGWTVTLCESEEFSGTMPMAFPSNSVNQTSPALSSTTKRRGDELLVGMLNSVSCWVPGSNRAILSAKCSLNQTSPDDDNCIQYGSVTV